ncbi:MAG: DUF1643 domain-containing protein [Bacteroidales bacterium]|jgi:hypothetical protein
MKTYQIDLYKNSKDNSLRFVLGSKGLNPLIVIGLNPSTADENKPDMTISKIIGFATRNNFDGFIMLNLYPQRATSPDNLDVKMNSNIHAENIDAIFNSLKDINEISILAAWGEPIKKRDYLKNSLSDIYDSISHLNINWLQIGAMTTTGHPRHPSRAAYDLGLKHLDIKQYISSLL